MVNTNALVGTTNRRATCFFGPGARPASWIITAFATGQDPIQFRLWLPTFLGSCRISPGSCSVKMCSDIIISLRLLLGRLHLGSSCLVYIDGIDYNPVYYNPVSSPELSKEPSNELAHLQMSQMSYSIDNSYMHSYLCQKYVTIHLHVQLCCACVECCSCYCSSRC